MLLEVYLQQTLSLLPCWNTVMIFLFLYITKLLSLYNKRTIVYFLVSRQLNPILPKVYTHVNITTISQFHAIFQLKYCRFLIKPKDQIIHSE